MDLWRSRGLFFWYFPGINLYKLKKKDKFQTKNEVQGCIGISVPIFQYKLCTELYRCCHVTIRTQSIMVLTVQHSFGEMWYELRSTRNKNGATRFLFDTLWTLLDVRDFFLHRSLLSNKGKARHGVHNVPICSVGVTYINTRIYTVYIYISIN
jgi:hypothetical protein